MGDRPAGDQTLESRPAGTRLLRDWTTVAMRNAPLREVRREWFGARSSLAGKASTSAQPGQETGEAVTTELDAPAHEQAVDDQRGRRQLGHGGGADLRAGGETDRDIVSRTGRSDSTSDRREGYTDRCIRRGRRQCEQHIAQAESLAGGHGGAHRSTSRNYPRR